MANQEQLAILRQGVEVWNRWRETNPDAKVDLSEADLSGLDLKGSILSEIKLLLADLDGADLKGERGVDLRKADLSRGNLSMALLIRADLNDANLSHANLEGAILSRADLTGSILTGANLSSASLTGTILTRAGLTVANLSRANLMSANFRASTVGLTTFGHVDLNKAFGLEGIIHNGPSSIGVDTIKRSKGKLPTAFLRGCGLSDWEIQSVKLYNPDLSNDEITQIQYKIYELRATQALQISPLFISYSHADDEFVDKLEGQLDKKGIRFWRDIHDMKAGRIERQIDRAISQNPTVLLVLSKNSLSSDWVEHEVRTARALEKEVGRDVLCPVALDDSWKSSRWPKRVMEQVIEYNILDFSAWKDDSRFGNMFRKLIDGLELFYKG